MMKWTDRHCRFFHRLLTRNTRLYTEMITTGAVLHGRRDRLLAYHPDEQPLALQIGGSDPAQLAQSARIVEQLGFSEINLNIGCPSDRVQSGRFGACLMAEPDLVARCVAAMCDAVSIPVTVKTRLGIDDRDSYAELLAFVTMVAAAGCTTFIIHARKAWLSGLSPKENRDIPPLDYSRVYRLKQDRPDLQIIINGGIPDLGAASAHLQQVDGVMIGRAAYQNPYVLAHADQMIFADKRAARSRSDVIRSLLPYIEDQCARGVRLASMTRHILGLFQGQPGGRLWRRHLSQHAHRPGADTAVIQQALEKVETALVPRFNDNDNDNEQAEAIGQDTVTTAPPAMTAVS